VNARLVRWLSATLLVVGLGLAGGAAGDDTAPGADISAARLHVTVSTTSNWTQLTISPGDVVASHVVARTGAGRYRVTGDGVVLSGVRRQEAVTVDLVLSDPTASPTFSVSVTKGFLGVTEVSVTNTNGAAYQVTGFTDDRHDTGDLNESEAVSVDQAQMMGTVPLPLAKADSRRLVLAAYYPWYHDYTSAQLADEPTQPRSVWNPADVLSMTRQAQAAGINGFVVSWHGASADGPAMDLVQQAAEATGQDFTAYLEVPSATQGRSAQSAAFRVRQWLLQALARRNSPAFLKADDGVPVVFVYGMDALSATQWRDVLVELDAREALRVHLVGDELDPAYRPYEWGLHRYAVLDPVDKLTAWSRSTSLSARALSAVDPTATPALYAGTVSPGFDDQRLRGRGDAVVPRDDGSRYDDTWAAALAGDPDWVFVSTWNEWYEDTQVEPGKATGGLALTQTATHVADWRR
jgi:hypothetical protein